MTLKINLFEEIYEMKSIRLLCHDKLLQKKKMMSIEIIGPPKSL